jgi:nitrite reductase/ring-hydroxylating ferredoxin subunit
MSKPESEFVDVGAETEIPEGTMKGFDVGRERVLVARVGGRLCAIGGLCTHQIAHLEDGVLERVERSTASPCGARRGGPGPSEGPEVVVGRVLCPRHGAAFDLVTGEPTAPADMPVEVHEVQAVGGRVRVRLRPCPGS